MPRITILYLKVINSVFFFNYSLHRYFLYFFQLDSWHFTVFSPPADFQDTRHDSKASQGQPTSHGCHCMEITNVSLSYNVFSTVSLRNSSFPFLWKNLWYFIVVMGPQVRVKSYFLFSNWIFKMVLKSFRTYAPQRDGKSSSIYISADTLKTQPIGMSTQMYSLSLLLSLCLSVYVFISGSSLSGSVSPSLLP